MECGENDDDEARCLCFSLYDNDEYADSQLDITETYGGEDGVDISAQEERR